MNSTVITYKPKKSSNLLDALAWLNYLVATDHINYKDAFNRVLLTYDVTAADLEAAHENQFSL